MAIVKRSIISDVFILESNSNTYSCISCLLYGKTSTVPRKSVKILGKESLVRHIERHIKEGHKVPNYVFNRLGVNSRKAH